MKKQNAWVKNLLFVCKNLTGKRFVLCVSIGRQQSHKKTAPRVAGL